MSESTPDSASGLVMDTSDMGTSSIDAGDNEPSMEDILASIRQIIAEDEVEEAEGTLEMPPEEGFSASQELVAAEIEVVQPAPPQNVAAESVNTQEVDAQNSEILDLMNFVDKSIEKSAQQVEEASQAPTEPTIAASEVEDKTAEPTAPVVGFDEGLDLVMDAEASDYQTTQVGTDLGQAEEAEYSLENELFADIERQNMEDEESLIIPEIPTQAKTAVETPAIEEPQAVDESPETPPLSNEQVQVGHDEDMDLVKSLLADLMDEPKDEAPQVVEEEEGDLHSEFEEALADTSPEVVPDVDFITGETLDADALEAIFEEDAPVVQEVVAAPVVEPKTAEITPVKTKPVEVAKPAEAVIQERDFVTGELIESVDEAVIFGDSTSSILDEVLQKSVEDEVALHEELVGIAKEEAPAVEPVVRSEINHKVSENKVVEPKPKVRKDIVLDAAAPIKEVANKAADDVQKDDDVVVLPEVDTKSKLSLLQKTTTSSAIVGLGAATALVQNNEEEAEAPIIKVPNVELEVPPQEKAELSPTENQTQKDEDMAQAAKMETILDEETVSGSASAFASLNNAVEEKAKVQDSGPAIGDLVQDALKPMLKEWLDKNLKGIVERAVTKEVKRISSGK